MNISDEIYRLIVTTIAQLDYAYYHGDGDCLEAAYLHAGKALKALDEKTAEEESNEES